MQLPHYGPRSPATLRNSVANCTRFRWNLDRLLRISTANCSAIYRMLRISGPSGQTSRWMLHTLCSCHAVAGALLLLFEKCTWNLWQIIWNPDRLLRISTATCSTIYGHAWWWGHWFLVGCSIIYAVAALWVSFTATWYISSWSDAICKHHRSLLEIIVVFMMIAPKGAHLFIFPLRSLWFSWW